MLREIALNLASLVCVALATAAVINVYQLLNHIVF